MPERINLTPDVWGPKTWFFLESMAMAYPDDPTDAEKLSAKNLILSLKDLLPCWGCRNNYEKYITEYFKTAPIEDIVMKRSTLIAFIIDVHNDVRVKQKKDIVSIEDTFKYYNNEYMSFRPKKIIENTNSVTEKFLPNVLNSNSNIDSQKFIKTLLYQYNPIMILIGIILGLIIYKFMQDAVIT